MINIVIPMAGASHRFSKVGYNLPKPLIPVNGIEMIRVVINNLCPKQDHRFIFICQKQHLDEFDLESKLKDWAPGSKIIGIDGLTEGPACTVLIARELIDNTSPLMIANCDQYINANINDYLYEMSFQNLDGLIMTMMAGDPKWSFVALNEEGFVNRVVEKEVISNEATVGIYNFKTGHDFVVAANRMISRNNRVNNEFYVAPAYNELIEDNKKVGIFNIGKEFEGMYGLGTPADLDLFLNFPIYKEVDVLL